MTHAQLTPVHDPDLCKQLMALNIRHPRIAALSQEIQSLIFPGSQSSILLVCGPTGVGKSTLSKHLVKVQLEKHHTLLEADASIIPAVYVQAPASGEKEFSWRKFYEDILEQLEGHGLNLRHQNFGVDPTTGTMYRPGRKCRSTLGDLRSAVESSLRERGTQFLVIDEAAHLLHNSNRKSLYIQLDALKSLANAGNTQIILVGSYDLYQLMSLSAQLARRTHVLHFERYRQDRPQDVNDFRTCLRQFVNILPHSWKDMYLKHAEDLMENSLGCIGTLSSILIRAVRFAESSGDLTFEMLERASLTQAQFSQIQEEIIDGEAQIDPSLTHCMSRTGHKRRS